MLFRKIIFILFLSFSVSGFSQNYFQQEVRFSIHVTLDDVKHELSGTDTIVYINNSPVVLNEIWMHIWPNAYKDNSTALSKQLLKNGRTFFYFSDDSLKGYIDKLNFKVNDSLVYWEYDSANIDICKLLLQKPLKPGDSITITTPFHVKIPDSRVSRLGHESQSYQISQWFPKPAVYDTSGWNAFPYLDQGEFYSEFGTFDVYITLPENYVVAATGDLVDGDKELKWLKEKATITDTNKSKTSGNIFPPSSANLKTLHYHQENVHDFAWFADKRYKVRKGEVELPYSKRKVDTWVFFYSNGYYGWNNALQYVNDAVSLYSTWVGEYPYNHATAVQGALAAGGGMEYPNITVISSTGADLEMVIIHEVGHNWFYGLLGSNERKFPWMDEGINSFYEFRCLQFLHPGSTMFIDNLNKVLHMPQNKALAERAGIYQVLAHLNADQPAGLPSDEYTQTNYGGIVYEKMVVVFNYLFEYLGEDRFDKAMQQFYSDWQFKHPSPSDLQNTFEKSTGENLDWFFYDMINSNKKLDYKICSFKKDVIKIKNKGEIAAPFSLMINDKKVWMPGFKGKQTDTLTALLIEPKAIAQINFLNDALEYNFKNNASRNYGLLKKLKPLKIQMLPGLDDPDYMQRCITPVFGTNSSNGFMPGVAIYNNPVPQKKFSFLLLPMYGTKNQTLNGIAKAGYMMLPGNDVFQYIYAGLNASKFSYFNDSVSLNYSKIVPEISIKLKNRNFNSSVIKEIRLRNVNIFKDEITYPEGSGSAIKETINYVVNEVSYSVLNTRKINPFSILLKAEQGSKFIKSSFEGNYRITYNKVRKGLDIRFFTGAFLYSNLPIDQDFRFRLSGEHGSQDYLFDRYYFNRNYSNSFCSQQFSETGGGFKIYTPLGQSWKWVAALNLKSSIPGKVPLRLYADFGTYEHAGAASGTNAIAYDAGIELSIINNIFEIYFPVLISDDIKKVNTLNDVTYWENIRFKLCLEKADPFRLLRNIK